MKTPIFMLLVAPVAASCVSNKVGSVDTSSVEDIPALIEGLAISREPASNQPFITLGNEENAKIAKRVYKIADELETWGIEAFPPLLETLNDQRQSVPFRSVLPSTVGDACYCIITRQLYALPENYPRSFSRIGADQKSHRRPVFLKSQFDDVGLKKWLEERESNSLVELQIEALTWVLEEERKIGTASRKDHRKFIAPLERKLETLTKKAEQNVDPNA